MGSIRRYGRSLLVIVGEVVAGGSLIGIVSWFCSSKNQRCDSWGSLQLPSVATFSLCFPSMPGECINKYSEESDD